MTLDAPDRGFSLIELLVAMALALVITAALAAVVNPGRLMADAQAEAMDMQQGARFAAAALSRDLRAAGAGLDHGGALGPLVDYLPAVLPRRIGARSPDAPTVARSDAFSMLAVSANGGQSRLASPFTSGTMLLAPSAGCSTPTPSCGFTEGTGVLAFDGTGRFDLFTATAVDIAGVSVRHRGSGIAVPYSATSTVAEVAARTYYFDPASRQIRQYDTDTTDTPVLDDVVEMKVEYFGRAAPPVKPKPPIGVANCLFDAVGNPLPLSIPVSGGNEVPLSLDVFRDGPWCGSGGIEFDADLLRVRRLRVTFVIQASSRSMRGRGAGFSASGTNRSVWNRLTDLTVVVDIAPVNLRLADQEGR
jgi:prepilin-type N-terminal cleavage/methylation domain-containing protein